MKYIQTLTIAVLATIMLAVTPAFAQRVPRSTVQTQDQTQGQAQGQLQGQAQGQLQTSRAVAVSGQEQVANGTVATTVSGNGDENKTYAVSYPALSGGEGISQANAYSIFGGLGLSNTEKYKVLLTQIQAIEAMQSLNAEEKKLIIDSLVIKMLDSNKDKRFLGLFWKTSGRDLSNMLGLLSWDSFWKDGQKPFHKQTTSK